jgi:hypothetical protein
MFSRVPRVLSPSLFLYVRQFMSLVINNERVLLCKPPPLEISRCCYTASGMWDARCCSLKYTWEYTCRLHTGPPCMFCLCLFLRRGLSHVAYYSWVWELARDRRIAFPISQGHPSQPLFTLISEPIIGWRNAPLMTMNSVPASS